MRLSISSFRPATKPSTGSQKLSCWTSLLLIAGILVGGLFGTPPAEAASVFTDSVDYEEGSVVGITGRNFTAGESVILEITYLDGTPLPPEYQATWTVIADASGSVSGGTSTGADPGGGLDGFLTDWMMTVNIAPGDSLLLTASGQTSGLTTSTYCTRKSHDLDQLKNGNVSHSSQWSHGSIHHENSCYSEDNSVPYRYFLYNMEAGETHYFTIQMDATKGGYHGLDYLTQYDLSESGPIFDAGGPCGAIFTSPPGDCGTPGSVAVLPDPRLPASYSSSPPSDVLDLVDLGFPIQGPGNLLAYNVSNVSLGGYYYTNSFPSRDLNIVVTFDVVADGSVGFYWGGHLGSSHPDAWGAGQGAGAISGADYHMRAGKLDGGGGSWSSRSIKTSGLCLPPDPTITCSPGPYCTGSVHTCSAPSGAQGYDWTVSGGTITSGQNTSSITYIITAADGEPVTVSVSACNNGDDDKDDDDGCEGDYCCAEDQVIFTAESCCTVDLTCPADLALECDQSTDPANTGSATYTVNGTCPTPITVSYTDTETPGACPQEKTITRTWTVTDGNSDVRDQCVQTITVHDTTDPVLVGCPADVTVECDAVPAPATVTASDNCDPAPAILFSETSAAGSCGQEYVLTRTWTATDACGNSSSCTQKVTVQDTQAPQITCPGPIAVQCLADVPQPDVLLVIANDNCDPGPVVTFVSDVSDGQTCPETVTRTYKAVDACGNVATCTQIITVDDTQAPIVTCPAPVTVDCMGDVPAPNTGLVSAADNCDPAPVITFVGDVPSGVSCPMTITRTYKATDFCGNEGTCTQVITVDDQTPPQITCPDPISVECLTDVPSPNPALVTAWDACGGTPTVTWVSDTPAGSCPTTITRVYKATDACGNEALCQQIITVDDQTAPVVTCPSTITVECLADVPAPNPSLVSATDNCDPNPVIAFLSDSDDGQTCPRTITRTYKATDACGNVGTCTQTILVNDITPPAVTCPANLTVQCIADVPAPNISLVTATDNCDPNPVVVFVADVSDGQSCPETITRTYRATDFCGNSATCTQTITVDDTIGPVIACPADVSVLCDDPTDPAFTGTATATDNCSAAGNIAIAFSDVINGGIVRTWTATDECGNQSSCVQTITIQGDNVPPAPPVCPPDISVECLTDVPAPAPGALTSTDNCDPNPIVTFVSDVQSGTTCPITITRTYRATDASGNYAECSQIITVNDQTPPVMVGCPTSIVISCDAPIPAPANVTATDNCGYTIAFSEIITPGNCPQERVITRTWTATDPCGNEASCVQTITIEDNEAPLVTCPGPIAVQCVADVPGPNTLLVTATDNCDPAPVVAFVSDVSDGQSCPETITRTYKATDACGNVGFCTQTITVDDTVPPNPTCPADVVVDCMADVPQPNIGSVTASDNCDPTPVITFVGDVPNGAGCPLTITRTYRATDACGNFAECSQLITVDDQTPPPITCPVDVTVECLADVPAPDIGLVTAGDNCGTPVVEWVSDDPVGSCPTIITRVYKATDDCGNEAFCQQIITVDDQTPPEPHGCPADLTVDCGGIPAPANVTATDNCPGVTLVFDEVTTPGACAYEFVVTRTWTATDACGNSNSCVQVITVQDNVPPEMSRPADLTVSCLADVPPADVLLVNATDNCDPDPDVFPLADQQNGSCPMTITRTYRATDACGNYTDSVQIITVDDQIPPECVGVPDDVTVECDAIPDPPVVTAIDNCDGEVSVDFTEGVIPGNCVYSYTLVRTWTATDACGNTSVCRQEITVEDTTPPVLTGPAAITVECIADVPVPDLGLLTAIDNCDPDPGKAHVSDDYQTQSCPGTVTRVYRATDTCGNESRWTQIITMHDQTPPVFTVFPTDQTFILCEPAERCLDLDAEDNCGGSVILSVIDGPGEVSARRWCYTPTGSGSFDVTIRAEDTCGNFVDDMFHVDVDLNGVPQFTNCPEAATIHWGETYTYDFIVADPDVGQALTFSLCETTPDGVTIDANGHLEWAAGAEDICDPSICVIVTDDCQVADTCEFEVCVTNDPPVIACPGDITICNGYPFEAQVTAVDPDQGPYALFHLVGGPVGVTVDATTGAITWASPSPGAWEICVEASDGAPICDPCSPASADTCCFTLNVVALDLVIETVNNGIQNSQTEVGIDFLHQGSNWPIAGYDLLIQYDPTALAFQMATEGQFLLDCQWEYFTYRFGASGNCSGGACPTGILRIIAMAETTGGNLAEHPDCYTNDGIANPGPGSSTATGLAVMHFMVTDDRTMECQFAPIRFAWYDCGDNALSNIAGDTLYISNAVYDYGGEIGEPPVVQWNEITGLDNTFPTLTGAPSPDCDLSDKAELIRCANFHNGGVDILCADELDAAGDININGIAYEIADAVMFTNYFISGLAAFEPHVQGSIAASDTNRDGLALSVADLVYIIRVVIGDALPYAKETPAVINSSYSVDDGVVMIGDNLDISGAALVVRGDIAPRLVIDGMDMRYAYDGTFTRIVVTAPLEGATLGSFRGAFVGGVTGEIVSIDLATSDGATVLAKNVPVRFSLTQNYPNPFNPVTTIEFALPEVTDYRLTVFNIQGQMVAAFDGRAEAPGVYRVEWDGAQHASGVYLYRLEAGSGTFIQTKKMLLLK